MKRNASICFASVLLMLSCGQQGSETSSGAPPKQPDSRKALVATGASAAKHLDIVLTGMIVYGPSNGRPANRAKANDLVLLFVDGRAPSNTAIPQHVAFIAFKTKDLVPSPTLKTTAVGAWSYISLHKDQNLSIAEDPKSGVTFYDSGVVRLSDMCPDAAPDPSEFTNGSRSLAKLTLFSGDVTVAGTTHCEFKIAPCPGGKVWGPAKMPNDVNVAIDMQSSPTNITVNSGTDTLATLAFNTDPNRIEIRVGDVPQPDAEKWLNGTSSHMPRDMPDFELFYTLAKKKPVPPPYPKKQCREEQVKAALLTAGMDTCPPTTP